MNLLISLAACFMTGIWYGVETCRGSQAEEFINKWLAALVIFQSIVFSPLFLCSVVFYPDWSVFYLFEPVKGLSLLGLEWVFSALMLTLMFFASIAGYYYARKRIQSGLLFSARLLTGVVFLAIFVLLIISYKRFFLVGEMIQFRSGNTNFLFFRFPGIAIILYLISIPAGLIFWRWMLKKYEGTVDKNDEII